MAKIKSITTVFKNELTPEDGVKRNYEERDEQGNVTLVEQYDIEGNLEMRVSRIYDDKSRLLEEHQFSTESEPDEVHSFEYFESGKLKLKTITYRDGSKSFYRHEYDEAEGSVEIEIVDDEGDKEGSEYRRYNLEGWLLEEEIFDEDQLELGKEIHYDDHGNILKQITEDGEGFIVSHNYHYERDEKSRVKLLKVNDDEGQQVRTVAYIYNDKDNLCEQHIRDTDRGWAFIVKWDYDDKDRAVKETRMDFDGNVQDVQQIKYNEQDLLAEQERTSTHGVEINRFKYEFYE